jgi:signal-transduction protein with cAMP-binding, CBS, and nucleotidyltransferase domain
MERLFSLGDKFGKISEEARNFIEEHALIIYPRKGEYYKHSLVSNPYWCFVLKGLVAGFVDNPSGTQNIIWASVPNEYFTGSRHPFTTKNKKVAIQFLTDSEIIQIPNHIIQFAQKKYPSFSELFHALKQKKIDDHEIMLEILRLDTKNEQYAAFRNKQKMLFQQLTVKQICQFLNIKRSTYYRALKAYNANN